jgi:hypothetical protein
MTWHEPPREALREVDVPRHSFPGFGRGTAWVAGHRLALVVGTGAGLALGVLVDVVT